MTSRCLVLLALATAFACVLAGPAPANAATAQVASPEPEELVVTGKAWPQGRLDGSTRPLAYRLDLSVDPSRPRFSGHVEIDVRHTVAGREIVLHGRDLAMRSVAARIGNRLVPGSWTQVDASGVARIDFDELLPVGAMTLVFDYSAPFASGPAGLYRTRVDGKWFAWSQFESIDARSAFPGFDQPGFKTPFTLTLRTPPGLIAIGNAPEAGTATLEGGLAVHRFAPTPPLPTYLVAIMTGPFAQRPADIASTLQRPDPLPLRIVTTPQNLRQTDFAVTGTQEIVRRAEDYFGTPFPFAKLDQVTTPMLPGAMENAGAVLYRDDILIMDKQAPPAQQRNFGQIVAHEIAHQWFGDLVTPVWWDDLWLNESFANWMGYKLGDAWRPDLDIASAGLAEGFAAMNTDALLAGRPVHQPIDRSDQIDGAFDAITYGKGGHVIGMFAAYLGEKTFRDGVRRYIAAHRFANATSEDFFAALAEASHDPEIVPAMRSLVQQQGVPLLILRRDGDNVTVSQVRYANVGTETPDTQWILPVCMRRGANRVCRIMTHRTESFEIKGDGPVMPNAGGTGYYRFELAERHWDELISMADTLPAGEALALTDSLYGSLVAGRGRVSELVRLSRRLARHPDPLASASADAALSALVRTGFVGSEARSGFARLRAELYYPELKQLGFDPKAGAYAGEPAGRVQRRLQVVASLLGTARGGTLRRELADATQAYLAGDKTALDPIWLDHGLDLYLYFGHAADARDLVERALASEDPVFRPAALAAAARSGDKAIAGWMLDLADPRLRESERGEILMNVMARSATRTVGYDWILAHLDRLITQSNGVFLARELPAAVGQFCSVDRAAEISRDLRGPLAGTPAALDLDRAIERVRDCGLLDRDMGGQINQGFIKIK